MKRTAFILAVFFGLNLALVSNVFAQSAAAPPGDVTATATEQGVQVSWNPSPDEDVANDPFSYQVLRDGQPISSRAVSPYLDPIGGLTPGTWYTYQVVAIVSATSSFSDSSPSGTATVQVPVSSSLGQSCSPGAICKSGSSCPTGSPTMDLGSVCSGSESCCTDPSVAAGVGTGETCGSNNMCYYGTSQNGCPTGATEVTGSCPNNLIVSPKVCCRLDTGSTTGAAEYTVTVPTNIVTTVVSNGVRITWTAPGGGSASYAYKIYRDGELIATTTSGGTTSYTDTTVNMGYTYVYQVATVSLSSGASSDPSEMIWTDTANVGSTSSAISPSASVTTCDSSYGTCQDSNSYTCTGQWLTGLCPGAANIRCCSQRSAISAIPAGVPGTGSSTSCTTAGQPCGTGGTCVFNELSTTYECVGSTTGGGTGTGTGGPAISGFQSPMITGLSNARVTDIVKNFLQWALGIFGLLAVGSFVFAGFQYLLAGGNSGMITTAKTHMIWSMVGIAVALSGIIIIQAIVALLAAS